MRPLSCIFVAACALIAPGAHAAALWPEGISGDLPDVPIGPGPFAVGPGPTLLAQGIITGGDVDFIKFTVPFSASLVIVDLDFSILQNGNGLLGVGPLGSYPTVTNDDDWDSLDDTYAGVASNPVDSVINLGATGTGASFEVGITFSGDLAFFGGTGAFEYDLWVYTVPVPAPAVSGAIAVCALGFTRRRR